jgi:uncharacterized membrane protein
MSTASVRVLVAGESWVSSTTHYKGWDQFSSTIYETGVRYLRDALEAGGCAVTHMPSHEAATAFPLEAAALAAYDVVILSDIGANTLLLHPDTWLRGRPMPNRLRLLRDWVALGGGLVMAGGYLSFQGINGSARYRGTAVEEILPVTLHPWDDRVEVPEGFTPEVLEPGHPIVRGVPSPWPLLLGYNELTARPNATILASAEGKPLLVTREYGKGRTLAWASDIGPHWCPEPFATWPGYSRLWNNAVRWLAPHAADPLP